MSGLALRGGRSRGGGAPYAQALAAFGGPVAGFDPGGVATREGVERADTIEAAVRNANLVVVLTGRQWPSAWRAKQRT